MGSKDRPLTIKLWYNYTIEKKIPSKQINLKVRSKVFYPSHGAGWVKAKKEIEFGGEKREYLEFEFINNPLSVSTPLSNLDSLGIREVYSPQLIKKKLQIIKKMKSKKPTSDDFNYLANLMKDLESKGEIDSFVEIIQYCNFIKGEREKDGRLVPSSIDKVQKNAVDHIACEFAVSADVEYGKALMDIQSMLGIKTSN